MKREVLCYFYDKQFEKIICRVGYYDPELIRWVIHSDGRLRYLTQILDWQEIPNMKSKADAIRAQISIYLPTCPICGEYILDENYCPNCTNAICKPFFNNEKPNGE